MSRTLSWKWLCSRLGFWHGHPPARVRPCLGALEQLEDRVLLSATPLIPLSNQSVGAVSAFLKLENSFEISQVDGIKLEADVIELKTNALSAAEIDYFLKIDGDLVQIDNDLIGTPGPAGSTGTTGIDGILTNLDLPVDMAINLEAELLPAVQSARAATTTVIGQLQQLQTAGKSVVHPAASVDVFLKIEGIDGTAADDATLNFAKIEYEFIGADATDLGAALGAQGSAAPGAAGGLLQDFVVLAADTAAGPNTTSGSAVVPARESSTPSVSEFVATESAYANAVGVYIHRKLPGRMKSGQITLSRGAADYFLKLDADLLQINDDLIGTPGAGSGIDGALLKLQLPQATLNSINALVTALGNADTAIMAQQKLLDNANIASAGSSLADVEAAAQQQADQFALAFAKIEINFINQTTGLGPALGLQGSSAPGPAGGLLQDALVLATDAGGTFPGAIVYPPPAVVDAFLKIDAAIIQNQNALVSAEQAYIKLGVQLPAVLVDYFSKIDSDLLEIDTGLLGTAAGPAGPGVTGIDSILENLNGMPATYVSQIQSLDKQVQSGQQAVTAAQTGVQNTSGTVTAAALAEFHKLGGIQVQAEAAFVGISTNFDAIVDQFIGLDPGEDAMIQDSKNIADGAAKGQAQE
jgi:hypothetical protein